MDLSRDPFWMAGTVAYWTEGSNRSNELSFPNPDPALVALFIRSSRRYLDVGSAPESVDSLGLNNHATSGTA